MKAILMPYVAAQGADIRVEISGPLIEIGERAATSLALSIHELATNAAKYGALSTQEGRVVITWTEDVGLVRITWLESKGPAIIANPARKGFGSALIDRSVKGQLGGTFSQEWHSDGLKVTLSIPISHIET